MILFRTTLPWLLPLLACGAVGAYALRLLQRLLASRTAVESPPIGTTAFIPLAILFGLRLITIVLQILGAMRIRFRPSLILVAALSVAAAIQLVRTWGKNPVSPRELAVGHRRPLTGLEAAAAAFALTILFCALDAEPLGWDVFTHWWVVPHEILSFDRMAYFYGTTRSVAPDYPSHQIVLGAVASLLSGGRDGIGNVFPGIFLFFAALATMEASWLLSRSRLLTGGALLALFAFSGTPRIVFGCFYGDALVITGIAFAFVGLVHLVKYRRRSSAVVVWACLSMPIMSKGLGIGFALLGGGGVALAYLFLGRREGQPKPCSWRAVLILTTFLAGEIVVPRLFLIGVTSNDYPRPPVTGLFSPPLKTILATLMANLTETRPIFILVVLLMLTPLLAVLRPRFLFRTSHKWAVAFCSAYALAVLGLFLAGTAYVPEAKTSWPRYATIAAPAIAVLGAVVLAHLGRMRIILSIPFMAVAFVSVLTAEYHDYVVQHSNWLKEDLDRIPRHHNEYVASESLYKAIRKDVDPIRGRVFYVMQDGDLLRPYIMSSYFAMAGIRAPLISVVQTCPQKYSGLAWQVDDWILKKGGKGPPPPEMNQATDFLYLGKPIVLSGHTYQDLVKVDRLIAGR
jgi:hypothetical protein